MRTLIIAFLLFSQLSSFSQCYSSGTYLIAFICNDGIIVGSDSRAVFLDNKNKIFAYYEGAPKLCKYKNVVMGIAGQDAFDSITIVGIFNKFTKNHKEEIPVKQFREQFLKFSKTLLKKEEYSILLQNEFLLCGYDNGKPKGFFYKNNKIKDSIVSPDFISNFESDNKFRPQFRDVLKNISTTKYIPIVEALIIDVENGQNKNGVSIYGGSPAIITINKTGAIWQKGFPINSFESIHDFAVAIKQKKVKMWYRSQLGELLLKQELSKYE